MSASHGELLGIDGEAIELEWNIFPLCTSLQILQEIQDNLQKRNSWTWENHRLDHLHDNVQRYWLDKKRKRWGLYFEFRKSQDVREEFSQGHWTFFGLGDEKKWYGKCTYNPEGKWKAAASRMVQQFKETGHPAFTSASALSRGILRMLKGKATIHFNADASNTERLFRITHSVNQLSIYGAVSNWCWQFGLRADEKGQENILEKREPVNKEILKSVNSQDVNSSVSSPRLASGNRLRENIQDFESLS